MLDYTIFSVAFCWVLIHRRRKGVDDYLLVYCEVWVDDYLLVDCGFGVEDHWPVY